MADATLAAAEQDADGWHEVEQTLTTLELPPVPPTSDPQRLLGYVLHILPRYTEMEMLATHLRLYASTLEQDMEQVKSHVRLLMREAAGERERKQFLERYAAQVVKERNDLLHSRGSSKKKAAGAGHFVWHSCCKKNTSHAMDIAPSILAFRGDKLQEVTKQIESLQEEVHNQEVLRKELDFLLKKTQREHDSKMAADRKHIQQLEKQIVQRSTLHSSLERKLYEVESVLAKHEKNKDEELGVVSNRVREARARITSLENQNAELQEHVRNLSSDRDHLTQLLEETTESKDVFADQNDELSEKCNSLESEVEALRSEIDLLQTKDVTDIRTQYAARINRLQQDHAASEQKLCQEVDRLNRELKKQSEAQMQAHSMHQSSTRRISRLLPSGQPSRVENVSLSPGDSVWSDGIFDDDREGVGSSLSRSQLSDSRELFSVSSSSAGRSHFKLSEEVGIDQRSAISTRSFREPLTEEKSEDSSVEQADPSRHDINTSASAVPFDWDTFIDSASDMSLPVNERSKRSLSAVERSLNFSSSTIPHEDSLSEVSDPSVDENSASDLKEQLVDSENSVHNSDTVEHPQTADRQLEQDEEENEDDKDPLAENSEKESCRGDDDRDSVETTEKGEVAQNNLAQDLYEMLNGLEKKRKEEEQKASQAEQALLQFQQLQQGVQNLQLSPDS